MFVAVERAVGSTLMWSINRRIAPCHAARVFIEVCTISEEKEAEKEV